MLCSLARRVQRQPPQTWRRNSSKSPDFDPGQPRSAAGDSLRGMLKQTRTAVSLRHQLNIGPRLTVCFAFIILAMMTGDAVLLRQFQAAQAQAERLQEIGRASCRERV